MYTTEKSLISFSYRCFSSQQIEMKTEITEMNWKQVHVSDTIQVSRKEKTEKK